MGQEIVYCSECALRLVGSDFDKGKAFRIEHKCLCADCAKKILGALPPVEPSKTSSQRIPMQKSTTESGSHARLRPLQESTVSRGMQTAPKKSSGVLIAGVVGAVVVLAIVVAVASSGGAPPPPPKTDDGPRPPEATARDREALDALDKALVYARGNPSDFEGQLTRLQEAAFKAEGTAVVGRVKSELDSARVRAQQTVAREIAALESRVRPLAPAGARAVLDAERRRFGSRDWDLAIRRLEARLENAPPPPPPPPAVDVWTVLDLQDLRAASGAKLEKKSDGSVLASGVVPASEVYTFGAKTPLKTVTAIRVEALSDPSLPAGGPGRSPNGNAVLGEIRVEAAGRPVAFSGAGATFEQDQWPASAAVDGNPLTGWGFAPRYGAASEAVFHAREPFDGAALSIALEFLTLHGQHVLGRVRVSATSAALPPPPGPRPIDGAYPPPLTLSGDGLAGGWINKSWSSKVDLKSAAVPAFEGETSIAVESEKNGSALYLGRVEAIDAPAYLSFAVYRADPAAFPYGVCVYGAGEKEHSAAIAFSKLGLPPVGQWRRYVIPLSRFKLPSGKIRGVLVQSYYTKFPAPPMYVDAVRLLPGPVYAEDAPVASAYRALWNQAAVHAAARDLDAAAKVLKDGPAPEDADEKAELAADLADFQLVRALHEDVRGLLAKWPRGWNISVDVLDAAGAPRRIDEPVRHADARGLELRSGETLEPGRILAPSLAEIFLARPKKAETDARAAALLCAIEGFPDAAKRFHPGALKAGPPAPDDGDARRFYLEAEDEIRAYPTRTRGFEKLAIVLKSHGETSYLRRLKASIQARLDAPREFMFAPADLQARGLLQLQRHGKGEIAWTMTEDVEKPARKDHVLDLEYSAPPGAEIRGWALIGGCCQETFTFHLQGSDVEGPDADNPTTVVKCDVEGTSMTPVLPQGVAYLKKTHAAHGGKKETERFAWVALPPMKRAGPGTQARLRILADQQGFAVAAVFLSAGRKAPPKEAEMEDLLAARPFAEPELGEGGVRGQILREIWKGIGGDKVEELTNNPKFKGPPDLSHRVGALDSWSMGDSYGTRFRGWIVPPLSGNYVFWLTSDDQSELWLSTDDGAGGRQKIAALGSSVGHRDWNRAAKSAPIPLAKGRRYYIEALHKQGGGGEHVTVGWTCPEAAVDERPILGNRLIPWTPATGRVGVTLDVPAEHPAGGPLAMTAGATGVDAKARIEIFDGATRLGEAKNGAFTWAHPTAGAHLLSARVLDKGRAVVSPPTLVVAGDLHFHRGVDFNGPAGSIDDRAWMPGTGPGGYEGPDVELRPATDAARARMIRSSVGLREAAKVVVGALPNAKFLVYATLWAPGESAPFDLAINGKTVLTGHRFASPGEWARLGPWPAELVDGRIEVSAPKGTAHLSGVEVWSPTRPLPNRRVNTDKIGGPGGGEWAEVGGDQALLVGFRVTIFNNFIQTLQGLYRQGEKTSAGQVRGHSDREKVEILAKPGYAVGGLRVREGGNRVMAFRVIFMKVTGPLLDPKDRYESDWIVGDEANTLLLGGDGYPAVGLHGRAGADCDAFGLTFLRP